MCVSVYMCSFKQSHVHSLSHMYMCLVLYKKNSHYSSFKRNKQQTSHIQCTVHGDIPHLVKIQSRY